MIIIMAPHKKKTKLEEAVAEVMMKRINQILDDSGVEPSDDIIYVMKAAYMSGAKKI